MINDNEDETIPLAQPIMHYALCIMHCIAVERHLLLPGGQLRGEAAEDEEHHHPL
jgi:hypothetical protein